MTETQRRLTVEQVPLGDLRPYPGNARRGDVAAIADSLDRNGQFRPLVVQRSTGYVLGGNHTLQAAQRLTWPSVQVTYVDVDDEGARRIVLADNRTAELGAWDERALLALLQEVGEDLGGTGYHDEDLDSLLASLDAPEVLADPPAPAPPAPTIAERFVVPPFTILDARSGLWRLRKQRWLGLGIQSELGRGEGLGMTNQEGLADIQSGWGITPTRGKGGLTLASPSGRVPTYCAQKEAAEARLGRELPHEEFTRDHLDSTGATENLSTSGTSVFDPVLTELAVRWFSPPTGHVLDPFAGGSVRGVVTTSLGRSYEGVELRAEQVQANETQRGIAPDGADLVWHQGDARELADGRPADLLLTCPPYAYLERYSDDPADLSTLSWEDFRTAHRQVIRSALTRLADDRFIVWVVGEVRSRGGDGHSVGLIADTITAFQEEGCDLYNEMIYVTPVGSLAVRIGRQFTSGRKAGRTHQHVLVFVKGDGIRAAQACGPVEVDGLDEVEPEPGAEELDWAPELEPAETTEEPEPATTSPAWARGYPVDRLKQITALFVEHDAGMIHGAFGKYGDVECAADLERGRLHLHPATGRPEVAWVGYTTTSTIPVQDFTGRAQPPITRGAYYVPRMAWSRDPAELRQALQDQDAVAVWAWQEHPAERALVASLGLGAGPVKVSAASEVRCLYRQGRQVTLDPADSTTIGPLSLVVPQELLDAALERFGSTGYAQHYSGYNKRSSWAAVALRGYWPEDPDRIEKPAEMSKAWKREHPEALTLEPADTALMGPEVRALLDLIPAAGFDRVRLMRLQPGGGELTRHADITDPDAGAIPGKAARIHIPLVSNPDCRFTMWDLDGRELPTYMAPGGVYYLDTRKPHTAINSGTEARIHLVADCRVSEELRQLIAAAGRPGALFSG